MKKNYFITNSGKLFRKDNSISFVPCLNYPIDNDVLFFDYDNDNYLKKERKDIPLNDIDSLFIMAEINMNKKFMELAGNKNILIHFFNFYNEYNGTFYPAEINFNGDVIINQVKWATEPEKRLLNAKKIIIAALKNITKNIIYYKNRNRNLEAHELSINKLIDDLEFDADINTLMLHEAMIRKIYYSAFNSIVLGEIQFHKREFNPPTDPMNALISFLNSLVYAVVLNEVHQTDLHPGISFIHSPGAKKFSLVWDLAEIFKPILADRIIFSVLNHNIITIEHFDFKDKACYLNKDGRKKIIEIFDKKVTQPINNHELNRDMSYKSIIRNECYKLIRQVKNEEVYKAFRIPY